MDAGKADVGQLTSTTAQPLPETPDDYLAGWSREVAVDAWRVYNRDVFWRELAVVAPRAALTHEDTTYADWIGAHVDLQAACADRADFTELWLQEIEAKNVPRNWLRWAADWAQSDMRITQGNPFDAQHAAYLRDCDVFLTADKNFVRVLDRLRKHAPAPIAKASHVAPASHANIVEAIKTALDS